MQHLSLPLSVSVSVSNSVSVSVSLSVSTYLCVPLSLYFSACLSVCLSLPPSLPPPPSPSLSLDLISQEKGRGGVVVRWRGANHNRSPISVCITAFSNPWTSCRQHLELFWSTMAELQTSLTLQHAPRVCRRAGRDSVSLFLLQPRRASH